MYVTIAGKRWRLVYARPPRGADACCDPPTAAGKKIVIAPSARKNPRRLMELLIHEALHAADWAVDEEAVGERARDIARLLWSQGFRLVQG